MRFEEIQEHDNTDGIQLTQDMIQYRDTVKKPTGVYKKRETLLTS
jgi:hypothetical protein